MNAWENFKGWILEKTGMKTLLNRSELSEKKEIEIQAAITFTNAIQDCKWLKNKSFYPGGWAVEYSFLLALFRILEHHKFSNLLEFGLGQTSRMLHQYAEFHKVSAITVEHDTEWVNFTCKDTHNAYPINVKILPLEMIDFKGYQTRTYKNIKGSFENQKFDLILVDGPFGSNHYSRSQIIHLAENNLASTFCIIIDDCNRIGEQETTAEVELSLKKNGIEYVTNKYHGLSDFTIICSTDLKFLASL